MCEDAVYHIQCSSNFQSSNCNPRENVTPRKCERDTTVDKKEIEIVEHMDSLSDKRSHIAILGKMMQDKLSGDNISYLI